MTTTERAEDYLKYIYILSLTQEVHSVRLAEVMGISKPTVCVALRSLEREAYLTMDRKRAISLTPKGMEIALRTYERNQAFQKLLAKIGVDDATAREDACRMEHAVSPESFAAMKKTILAE